MLSPSKLNLPATLLVVISFLIPSYGWTKTIVIVGAGLAGLTVAHEIQEAVKKDSALAGKPIDIQVIEAKDRPGGRVFSTYLNGNPAELGAENINDGGDATNLMALIESVGLKTQEKEVSLGEPYFLDQKTGKTYHLYKDLMPAFPNIPPENIGKDLAEGEKKFKNLGQIMDWFFKKYEPTAKEQKQKYNLIKERLKNQMFNYEGGKVDVLAARYATNSFIYMLQGMIKGYGMYQKGESRSFKVKSIEGGNSKLILALAESLGPKLALNSPLREVKKNSGPNFSYQLTVGPDQQTRTIDADFVVLTLPASVYKNIAFQAGTVPTDRLKKISSIPYGTHAKILVPIGATQTRASLGTTGLSGWMNPERTWINFYLSGPTGVLANALAFSKTLDSAALVLNPMGFDIQKTAVKIPTTIFEKNTMPIGMSWAKDPYIQGSYSHISAQTSAELLKVTEVDEQKFIPLFAPINGKIFFAGEHTTVDQDTRGTMEAAVESGIRVSRVLLKKLK